MSNTNPHPTSTRQNAAICRQCETQIPVTTDYCPRCGTEHPTDLQPVSTALTDNFSVPVWTAAVIYGVLTFPIGLITPVYLYLKSQSGAGMAMSSLESWTVVLFSVIGIAVVEIGGRRGAKTLYIFLGFTLLSGIALQILVL